MSWRREPSTHDGTRIAWRRDGRDGGLPVVLCNGITCDETYWRFVWRPLARRRPVVRFAYRGHARSEFPADPDAIAVEHTVADTLTAMDAAGIDRAVLVGHSYGVQVAWAAHGAAPGRVAGLVAVAGTVYPPLPGGDRLAAVFDGLHRIYQPAVVRELWSWLLRSPAAYPVARATGFVTGRAAPADMRDWFDQLAERDMRLMFRMMRHMQTHEGMHELASVDVPAAVLAGSRDLFAPPRVGRVQAERMPDSSFEVVAGASHVLPLEFPDRVVTTVEDVIERAERAG